MMPPWHATFLLSFKDKNELAQGLFAANFFNSQTLIDLLSFRIASLMIEARHNKMPKLFESQEPEEF
jgi:hypothetical protein